MRRIIASAATALALATGAVVAGTTPASAGTCGDVFNDVEVDGGEANWVVECTGGYLYIDGKVKDTKADGKCAYVKAFIHGGREEARACPKNTTTFFTWRQDIRIYGKNANAYLYVA